MALPKGLTCQPAVVEASRSACNKQKGIQETPLPEEWPTMSKEDRKVENPLTFPNSISRVAIDGSVQALATSDIFNSISLFHVPAPQKPAT